MSLRPKLAIGLGAVLVLSASAVGVVDGSHAWRNWDRLGPLPPGQPVPAFAVQRLEGSRFDNADLEGQVTVMTFWATWCPACRSELDDLDDLDDRYVGEPVQFLAVNLEGAGIERQRLIGAVRRFAAERGLELPVALDDGSAARVFRVGPIPHTLIFDPQGRLRHVHQGRVTSSTLEEEIEQLRE